MKDESLMDIMNEQDYDGFSRVNKGKRRDWRKSQKNKFRDSIEIHKLKSKYYAKKIKEDLENWLNEFYTPEVLARFEEYQRRNGEI